jgi:hypothetical protein
MITIFNRRELTNTFSMEQQARIRELLSAHKINYILNVINMLGPNHVRMGTFGQNMSCAYEYKFYVHKKDYELAHAVITGRVKI